MVTGISTRDSKAACRPVRFRPDRLDTGPMNTHVSLVSLIVDDYDHAIALFVDVLGFELVEDSPSTTERIRV